MRGIRPPALFELRAQEWRNAVDSHHTPRSGSPLFSKQVRPARPVDIPNWSAWGELHSQGCSGLSRTGLLFPANHTPVGDPGLAPGRLGDFKSPGSAVPAEASRREMACRAEAPLCVGEARLRTACYGAAASLLLRCEPRVVKDVFVRTLGPNPI